MKVKAPKRTKNKLGQRQLVSQDDFYSEATDFEEQAERWILSDIRKTLRFYVQAIELYEKGLNAANATAHGTYNIMYNETRLFLQIYTDYLANTGYINLLQYVRLDDIANVSQLALPLNEIIDRFEKVTERFPYERSWDLDSNLLTSYLTLIESADSYSLRGEDIVELTRKFADLSRHSIENQFSELKSWDATIEEEESGFERDTTGSNASARDGSGVVSQQDDMSESMEMTDQITVETLSELLSNSYKFVQSLMEIIIEARLGESSTINPVQLNYLDDMMKKFTLQLKDVHQTICESLTLDEDQINVVLEANRGIEFIANGDLSSIETYVSETLNSSEISTELLLAKIDVLDFAVTCIDSNGDLQVQWQMCSLLNKLLAEARKKLADVRANTTGKMSSVGSQLSSLVFQQCDVLIASSDFELRRWVIKRRVGSNGDIKTMEVLMKNAKTFLVNASKIAERPCGLEENIVDKLKRNYIYNQAQARLSVLEGRDQAISNADISELYADHPFYKNAPTFQ